MSPLRVRLIGPFEVDGLTPQAVGSRKARTLLKLLTLARGGAVPVDVLGERVRQLLQGSSEKQLYLRGDATVQLQELMDVFGRLKEAGVQKIGIVAEERRAGR